MMNRNPDTVVYMFLLLVLVVSVVAEGAVAPTPTPRSERPIILLTEGEEYADSSGLEFQGFTARETVSVTRAPRISPPVTQPAMKETRASIQSEQLIDIIPEQVREPEPVEIPPIDIDALEAQAASAQAPVAQPPEKPQKTPREDALSYMEQHKQRYAELLKKSGQPKPTEPPKSNVDTLAGETGRMIDNQLNNEYVIIRVVFETGISEIEQLSLPAAKEADQAVRQAIDLIRKSHTAGQILVLGYADDYALPERNQELAENRAQQIHAELVARLFRIRAPFPEIVYKSVARQDYKKSSDTTHFKKVEILISKK